MMYSLLQKVLLSLLLIFTGVVVAAAPVRALDLTCPNDSSGVAITDGVCTDLNGGGDKAGNMVGRAIQIFMYVVGGLAVIILIIAGISYATAAGNEASIKKARSAIVGALVGLVIAVLAWAIASFVLTESK